MVSLLSRLSALCGSALGLVVSRATLRYGPLLALLAVGFLRTSPRPRLIDLLPFRS